MNVNDFVGTDPDARRLDGPSASPIPTPPVGTPCALATVGMSRMGDNYSYAPSLTLTAAIVVALHEAGVAAPSTTTVDGKLVIRAAIVNHRTGTADVDRLVDAVLEIGQRMAAQVAR